MKILLIDTTTKDLVVALICGDTVIDCTQPNLGTRHSETLCLAVDQLLQKSNVKFDDLDAYACAIGPGSFTGIRIGVSTVKGYNVACPKKLLALNTLQAISCSVNCGAKGSAIIDAGNGYYFADYTNGVAPCLIAYDDPRIQTAGSGANASNYFDGLVLLAKQKYESDAFDDTLEPLYIRKSQAEEQKK